MLFGCPVRGGKNDISIIISACVRLLYHNKYAFSIAAVCACPAHDASKAGFWRKRQHLNSMGIGVLYGKARATGARRALWQDGIYQRLSPKCLNARTPMGKKYTHQASRAMTPPPLVSPDDMPLKTPVIGMIKHPTKKTP